MFERLVSAFLTRLLREYVEDSTFSRETVKLGIWRGYLVLEDMHIKKGLLDTMKLPLALAHGLIGRLEIRIPWTNLLREPIVVAVDQVFLVVEPKFEWDAEAVKRREESIKSAKIAAADLLRNLPLNDSASTPAEGSSKSSWVSGLKKWLTDSFITRIFDSLQIHIREVHVRYEDHLSRPGAPFYVGAMIESLHAESTLETGRSKPGLLQGSGSSSSGGAAARRRNGARPVGGVSGRNTVSEGEQVASGGGHDSLVKKELNLNQLAVYWNPTEDGNPCSMHLSDIPVEQAEVVLSRLINRKDQVNASKEAAGEELLARDEKLRHRYILEPVDVNARLTLNVDPKDRSRPKCKAQVEVGTMSGRLEDFQVKGGMCLVAALARYDEVGKYFKYRPEVPVRVDPSAWWRFAFKVVVERLRVERGWRQAFPDVTRRRRERLEYISLWQKSRGWATEWDEDIAGYDESRPPRSPTSSVGASQTCSSPGSTASSAPSSAQVLSSLESSGEDVDTEAPVWPAGISGRSTMARSRTRRAAAHEEVVAAKARLEELESELSAEDIIFFRTMAEREEAQKFGRVRKGVGNRWSISGWVNWALGSSEEKVEQESIEDELRRVYASIYADPPRSSTASPPPPSEAAPGGERTESLDLEGWLAISLSVHAKEGGMVLANSGATVSRSLEVIPSRSGSRPFAGVRFRGFRLCAELLGDDMDGVLASLTLDDLSVHEIQSNNARSLGQDLTSGGQPLARDGDEGTAEFSSVPIVARRVRPAAGDGRGAESLSRLPLFDMHFEVNPKDPEYDSRVYLDVDQVEVVISPSAVWLEEAMMFKQTPAELEHQATLKLAASNQLRNIRAQLDSKLEMVMSKRLRTYLNLKVKAPLVTVSVDLNSITSVDPRSSSNTSNSGSAFASDPAVATVAGDARQETPGYGTHEVAESRRGQGVVPGVHRRRWTTRTDAIVAEHLVIDLGDISFSTASLARPKRDMGGRDSVAAFGAASTSTDSENGRVGYFASPKHGRSNEWELASEISTDTSSTTRRRRARASSDVAAPVVEGWHANFYDIYNIGVGRVGVLLVRSHDVGFGGDDVEGLLGEKSGSNDTGVLTGDGDDDVVNGDGVARRWLVCPFDVKVEFHLSVIPRDPNISQLKVYADLSRIHVRLSQDKLRRLAGMSAAITAQSAVLQASRVLDRRPSDIQQHHDPDELDDRNTGSVGGAQSSLASFLEFQRALSNRFDHLRQAPDSSPNILTPRSINSPGRRGVRGQSLLWESGGGSVSGSANGDEEFASAWGGSSSRGSNVGGVIRSNIGGEHRGLVHPLPRSSSAESEFYDAIESRSAVDGSEYLPPVMAAEAGIGDTGSREGGCRTGVFEEKEGDLSGSAEAASMGGHSEMDNDSLEFEDARDPIAEMDEALMAKEAEKAELMKQRQKLREQLARPELAGAELESLRFALAEVSKSLEACEDELKGLETELEELTEVFENAGGQARADAENDEFGQMWGGQSQEQDIVNGRQDTFATPTRASSPDYLSSLSSDGRGIARGDAPDRAGSALAVQQAASVGPNREIIMCGLTMPLVQVDLLQDKGDTAFAGNGESLSRSARVSARDGRDSSRQGRVGGGGVMGNGTEEEEQQEVVSLRLVGLGMQLHSKSYNARFCFSMQDLDLEDRLGASQTANGCLAAAGAGLGDAGKRDRISLSPTTKIAQKAVTGGSGDGGDGGLLGGDMATSRPRLFLWERPDQPSRRAVTFSVGAAGDDVVQSHSAGLAADVASNGLETRGPAAVSIPSGGGQSGGNRKVIDVVQQSTGRISRPDFIQISYAMKKVPVGGKDRGLDVAQRGPKPGTHSVQETHRVKLLVGALEMNLEQETVLALLRIASSATMAPDSLGGHVGVADTSRGASASHTEGRRTDGAGIHRGRVGGDGPSVPVLAQGVSVTVAADVSALSVALREAGHNVAAVTACAVHCKINAESTRVKAIASLGEFSVLNLLGQSKSLPPTTSLAARAVHREEAVRRLDLETDRKRCDEGSSILLDPVIGQGQGAAGPIFEVALAVASSGAHDHSGNLRDVVGASRGSEARVKVKVDNVQTALSVPFVENMARFVLTGPLITHLLKKRVAARDVSTTTAPSGHAQSRQNPPSLPIETLSVVANGETRGVEGAGKADGETKRGPSLPAVLGDAVGPSREGGDVPDKRLQGSNWEKIVSWKVGLEVSDFALNLPVDLDAEDCSKINRVKAEVGHLLASAVWTRAVMRGSSGSNGLSQGVLGRDVGSLRVETLLSTAAIKVLPEGFDLLQPVHSRAIAVVPLVGGTGVASYAEGVHRPLGFHDGGHDELAEKLREKCNLAFTERIPSRPSLSFEGAARDAERPQVRVTVSPIVIKLVESHMMDLACFTVGASARLTKVSEILALPSWKTLLSRNPPSLRTPGRGRGNSITDAKWTSTQEREGRPPRHSDKAEYRGGIELPPRDNSSSDTHEGLDGPIRGSGDQRSREVLVRESPPRFQEEEEALTTTNGPVSAPLPPALFGTLVVNSVDLLLLTDPQEGDSGTGANAEGPGASASGDCLDHCASGVPEPWRSEAFLRYTPVMLLKVQGLGVGVNMERAPLLPRDRSSTSRVFSSRMEGESTGSRIRSELAIKAINLMDVRPNGRDLLIHLIESKVGGVPVAGEEEMGAESGGNGRDDDRILPAGWWDQGRRGESAQGYGEQVLCRALICSVSNTVSVDSHLAFGRFVLLPAPILDTMMLMNRLRHGVATFYQGYVRDGEGEGHLAESVGGVVRAFAGSWGRSYEKEVPPQRGGPRTYSGHVHRYGNMFTRRNDEGRTISLPQGIAGGHLDTSDDQSNREQQVQRRCIRQRAARVLGGARLADFRWLEKIQLSFSASHTQLCIPDGAGMKPTAAAQGTEPSGHQLASNVLPAVDQGVQEVETIVASCGSCRIAITVSAHRLSTTAKTDENMEPTISNSVPVEHFTVESDAMREEKKDHEADDIPDPDSRARDHSDIEANDSYMDDPVEEAPPGDEVCVMSVCANGVEVFIARLSQPDFGEQTDPLLFSSDFCDRAREPSGETKVSDTPSGFVPPIDERVPNFPRSPGTPPNVARVLREHASPGNLLVTSGSARDSSEVGGETLATDAAPDISGRVSVSDIEGAGSGRRTRGRGSRRARESLVLPFSLNIRHVLYLLNLNSPTSSTSPLLSQVDAEVSAVEVACPLDFPLATRIMQNAVVPLSEGLPAFAEERGSFWDGDQSQNEDNYSRSAETQGEDREATRRSSGVTINRQAHVSMGMEGDTSTGLGIASELAALWSCRFGLGMEGLLVVAINNFYRQKRPFARIIVQPITGQLMASGADRNLQASISARTRSEYYNARLMAWEPLLEEWGTQIELEVGIREHNESGSTAVDVGRHAVSFREGGVLGNQHQTAGRSSGATQQEQELRASSSSRPRDENTSGGLNVRISVASDEVINLNLTEPFMENLAVTIHARQRKKGKLEGAWVGDVRDESFSLHMLRNETGLPLFCRAHCEPFGGGGGSNGDVGGGSPPLHLSVGEELPMPSFSDPTSFSREINVSDANGVTEVDVEIPTRVETRAGVAEEVEGFVPASSLQESEHFPSEVNRRSPSASHRSPFEIQGVNSATRRSSEVSWNSRMGGDDGGIRQRPMRWIMLEFKDTEEGASAGAELVATRWQSLWPIGVDEVGQRLTTMDVSSADATPPLHEERRARSSRRSIRQPRSWSWTRGTNPSKARRVTGRSRAVKVVTEVESHHGVKVVRIRSQAKVVNRAGDLSLHVGLVGMDWNEEERSQSPGDGGGGGGGRRFVWETVVHPGHSCPVPATMAEAVVEGRRPLIVRPIARRPSGAVGTSARSSAINSVAGGIRTGDVPGHGLSDDFEEAVLALPALPGRREGTNGSSYHRTIEFASRAPAPRRRSVAESHGTGRSIFCGVSVAREVSGRSKRRGEKGSRKTGLVTVVSFVPSMLLTNLLATPADVVLSRPSRGSGVNCDSLAACLSFGQASEGAAWSGTIKHGTAKSWLQCSPREQVSMAIRVPGFEWSNAVVLPLSSNVDGDEEDDWMMTSSAMHDGSEAWTGGARSTSTAQKSRGQPWRERIEGATQRRSEAVPFVLQVALKNSEGATLRVNAEVTFLASELRQVSLWVPYWVVNATSLPLTLQHYYPAAPSGIIHGTSDEIGSTTSLEWELPVALESNLDASGSSRSIHDDAGRERTSSGSGVDSRGREDRHRGLETQQLGDDRPRMPPSSIGDDLVRFKPLMLPHSDLEQHKQERARLRLGVEGSTWSDSIGLDQVGSVRSLEIGGEPTARGSSRSLKRAERKVYAVGVSVKAAPTPFGRTKVVALTPRYVIINATQYAIEVQQAGLGAGVEPLKVVSGGQASFHWPKAGVRGWLGGGGTGTGSKWRRLIARRVGEGWEWSGEMLPEGGGDVTLRVRNSRTREVAFIRVGSTAKDSLWQLVFRDELPTFAPYRIENLSLETLTLRQAGVNVVEILTPYRSCSYSWDEPLGERALVVERLVGRPPRRHRGRASGAAGGAERDGTRRDRGGAGGDFPSVFVGIYGLDLLRPPAVVGRLRIETTAEGPTRTLRFTDARSASVWHSTGAPSAPVPSPPRVSLAANVRLAEVGLSVIDAYPRELLYLSLGDVALGYLRGGQGESIRANIGKLQVDNQLLVTPYPALLYPISEALPPRHPAVRLCEGQALLPSLTPGGSARNDPDNDGDRKACFELILRRELGYAWVNFVRLISVRVAPMDLNLDMALVDAFLELSTRMTELMDVDHPRLAGAIVDNRDPASTSESTAAPSVSLDIPVSIESLGTIVSMVWAESGPPNKVYLEELAISPIRVQVSFTSGSHGVTLEHLQPRGEGMALSSGNGGATITGALLRAMGTTLGQIENAPLVLKPVVLTHIFDSPEELSRMLLVHYRGQAVRQVFNVMGSSKLLGSPLGLFSNIGAGVKDFFYEPLAGLSRSPFGFAFGVFRGTSSLVRRTLYSVTDTTDRIISSVSSGILASGAVDVVVRGGSGVVRPYGPLDGVMLGVSGAVREPLLGLRSGGFMGMATGLLTGWIGLVLRPTYGTMMSTSQLCQVVSSYLDPRLDSEQKLRMIRFRPPRFFRSHQQVLSAYSREENIGEELLSRVHMGRYRSDGYVWHTIVKDMIILVTWRRIMLLHGDAGRRGNPSLATRGNSYGAVEWEVDFRLVVWLEANTREGGRGDQDQASRTSTSTQEQVRAGVEGGESDDDGGGSGPCVLVYHVPDLLGDICSESRDRRTGHKLPALRFERRVVLCADREQALQINRVLWGQVHAFATTSSV